LFKEIFDNQCNSNKKEGLRGWKKLIIIARLKEWSARKSRLNCTKSLKKGSNSKSGRQPIIIRRLKKAKLRKFRTIKWFRKKLRIRVEQ
jgi:hypothetical protein